MTESVLSFGRIKNAIAQEAPLHDVTRIYLFGSYARGEAGARSDVDLCLETGPSFSLFSAGDLSYKLSESLGVPIDLTTEKSLYSFVREGMLDDRVLVYERN